MLTSPPVLYDFCVGDPSLHLLTVGSTPVLHSVLNVKVLRDCTTSPMDRFTTLVITAAHSAQIGLMKTQIPCGELARSLIPDLDPSFTQINLTHKN